MKKTGVFQFALGIVVGAIIFGGSVAYAAGIMAQPKTAEIVIDGQAVDLKGYIIEDAHYFQLRDLSDKLAAGGKDFSIVWDGANNRVLIDTTRSYDPNEQYRPASQVQVPEQPEVTMTFDEMKMEIVRLTNEERTKAGLQWKYDGGWSISKKTSVTMATAIMTTVFYCVGQMVTPLNQSI